MQLTKNVSFTSTVLNELLMQYSFVMSCTSSSSFEDLYQTWDQNVIIRLIQ